MWCERMLNAIRAKRRARLAARRRTARECPDVQDVSRVRVRWVGHALEASFAITVDCDMTVSEGHRVAEEVRHRLLHDVAKLDTAVIHVNPCGHDGADPHEALRHHDVPAVPAR